MLARMRRRTNDEIWRMYGKRQGKFRERPTSLAGLKSLRDNFQYRPQRPFEAQGQLKPHSPGKGLRHGFNSLRKKWEFCCERLSPLTKARACVLLVLGFFSSLPVHPVPSTTSPCGSDLLRWLPNKRPSAHAVALGILFFATRLRI